MDYLELKNKHMGELAGFPIVWAFSESQLEEGLTKLNTTRKDICSIRHGGYIRKSDVKDFGDMLLRHSKEMSNAMEDNGFMVRAMEYELANHEYCITGDPEPALRTLGFTKDTMDDRTRMCLKTAIRIHNEQRWIP